MDNLPRFFRRPLLRAALLLAAAFGVVPATAQTFPTRGVRIIVPQTPGGASDALARVVGQKLSERWGQPVVIENRAGAGGNIGMEAVAQSPADGHTLLMSYVGSHAINVSIYRKLPFDPEKDFAAVGTLANVPFVAVVNPKVPATGIKEFAAWSQTHAATFGSAGNGSVNHLLGEMFNTAASVRVTHVPYKGAAPALTDLISGQIQLVFTSLPSVAPHIRSGAVRPLAVTGSKRSQAFRDIPTMAESGYPGFVINPWFGFFAPAGTPAAVITKINADLNRVLEDRETVEKFAAQGAEVLASTPQELAAMLHQDIQTWAQVVRQSGARVD